MDICCDKYADDIDVVNISDIVDGGVVKDSAHGDMLGYLYPFTPKSKTKSITVKFLVKTNELAKGNLDGSFMVVDLGGNCGHCRSYIPAGGKENTTIMFGWEIAGCPEDGHHNPYSFKSNSWYAFEQGRWRVVSGEHKGKDYVYLKVDGKLIRSFYAEADSRPFKDNLIYIEATYGIQVWDYNELCVKYYVDDKLFLDQFAQKGLDVKKPDEPKKENYYFIGWYTEKSGGKLFDFKSTKLSDNISLYARFTDKAVNITFKFANGMPDMNVISGKGCLVNEPPIPTYTDEKSKYVFAGWKNEKSRKIFDLETDRPYEDTVFTAQYKEKEFFVSYYSLGELVGEIPFVLSNPTVKGKEPEVPEIPNTKGIWETHSVDNLKGNMTVNAVYSVTLPKQSEEIKLKEHSGNEICIVTDILKEYLSLNIDKQTSYVRNFCSMPSRKYRDRQEITFRWTDSGENGKYTLYFADNKEFKNAYITTTDKTALENEVGIFVPGKTYYWFVFGNETQKSSAVDCFKIFDMPLRYITASSVVNMRDLGGFATCNGKKVKYGLVYRGAALDELSSHIDDNARNIFGYLGIKSEIELRGGVQHDFTAWDQNNPNVYYVEAQGYQVMLFLGDEQNAQYKAAFEAMADKKNYPFYFHCSGGADRTGSFAYLILGLLGVPYKDIRADYELTSFSKVGIRPADIFIDNNSFDEMNRIIIEQYGDGSDNLQIAVENFLINHFGVTKRSICEIKEILTEDK